LLEEIQAGICETMLLFPANGPRFPELAVVLIRLAPESPEGERRPPTVSIENATADPGSVREAGIQFIDDDENGGYGRLGKEEAKA
jgi:hypothetical protein